MKFREYVIKEARLEPPDVLYRTVGRSGKETTDPEKITKVYAQIFKQDASAATKLAMSFDDIYVELKKLEDEMDAKKENIREQAKELFDVADEAITRVIETRSCLISIHKAAESDKPKIDYEKIHEKLLELKPELTELVNKLKEEFTKVDNTIKKSVVKVAGKEPTEKIARESVQLKEDLASILGSVKGFFGSLLGKIKEKLTSIKSMIPAGVKIENIKPGEV